MNRRLQKKRAANLQRTMETNVAASDFGAMPKQGAILNLDGKIYRVADAVDEYGIYSITIEANRA